MRLRPFFYFYGSKWGAAARYPLPRYDQIIEPFAGGAGYSLNYPQRQVWLNDLDPTLAGLWSYLTRVSREEVLRLPLDFDHVDDLSIPQEARWLIGFWLNKGTTAPRKQPSKWMRSKTRPNTFWGEHARDRIARQVGAIRHWKITEGTYADLPSETASWFIDPPYQKANRRGYKCGSDAIDYGALAEWVMSRRGQVIVCVEV